MPTDRSHPGGPEATGAAPADPMARLRVGHRDSVSKTITAKDVDAFARLTGDFNALHVDDEFAARTGFEHRVVHGFGICVFELSDAVVEDLIAAFRKVCEHRTRLASLDDAA